LFSYFFFDLKLRLSLNFRIVRWNMDDGATALMAEACATIKEFFFVFFDYRASLLELGYLEAVKLLIKAHLVLI